MSENDANANVGYVLNFDGLPYSNGKKRGYCPETKQLCAKEEDPNYLACPYCRSMRSQVRNEQGQYVPEVSPEGKAIFKLYCLKIASLDRVMAVSNLIQNTFDSIEHIKELLSVQLTMTQVSMSPEAKEELKAMEAQMQETINQQMSSTGVSEFKDTGGSEVIE